MPISFACQHCGRDYCVADTMAGKRAKCKSCSQAMDIPAESVVAAEIAAEHSSNAQTAQQPTAQQQAQKRQIAQQSNTQKSNAQQRQGTQKKSSKKRRADTRAAQQQFGLSNLNSSNDPFAGTNANQPTPQLGNYVSDPGFAYVTPEDVAYRREMEIAQLRDTKPTLEDYLDADGPRKISDRCSVR